MIILETKRLQLRMWKNEDIDPLTAINQDPKVCEYLLGPQTRSETAASIQRFIAHQKQYGFSLYAVELKSSSECIGWLGLMHPSFDAHFTPAIEIGWWLASQHWNQGYATEGAKAVRDYAFTKLDLDEIVSFTVVANISSRRVMEKIGMHHNPQDDFDHPRLAKTDPLCRHVLYRLSQKEWEINHE